MPTNLYGPGDNYHPTNSHVLPALILRFHEAAERGDASVTCWGSGTPLREFLHVDDLGEACVFALEHWLSLPRFQGQCLESCFYTDPMKTNDHNECPVYATPLQR